MNKPALAFAALLSFQAPSKIVIPLKQGLAVELLTSGLSYNGYLAALHPSSPSFAARCTDADIGLCGDERIDLPTPAQLGIVIELHIPLR